MLVYDLNAIEFLHGMSNSQGNFAWECQIPCSMGDTKITERVPKSGSHVYMTLGEWGLR